MVSSIEYFPLYRYWVWNSGMVTTLLKTLLVLSASVMFHLQHADNMNTNAMGKKISLFSVLNQRWHYNKIGLCSTAVTVYPNVSLICIRPKHHINITSTVLSGRNRSLSSVSACSSSSSSFTSSFFCSASFSSCSFSVYSNTSASNCFCSILLYVVYTKEQTWLLFLPMKLWFLADLIG